MTPSGVVPKLGMWLNGEEQSRVAQWLTENVGKKANVKLSLAS
ncbi:Uncharacterised protein [Cronobacter sakazakii]|nr:Uncharacterised protein [Cronobacter sakazakii]